MNAGLWACDYGALPSSPGRMKCLAAAHREFVQNASFGPKSFFPEIPFNRQTIYETCSAAHFPTAKIVRAYVGAAQIRNPHSPSGFEKKSFSSSQTAIACSFPIQVHHSCLDGLDVPGHDGGGPFSLFGFHLGLRQGVGALQFHFRCWWSPPSPFLAASAFSFSTPTTEHAAWLPRPWRTCQRLFSIPIVLFNQRISVVSSNWPKSRR